MQTNKKRKLLELLLKQNGIVTVSEYAKVLGMSKRSIYSYLDDLEDEIKRHGLSIKRIPSKGIMITRNDEFKEEVVISEANDEYSLSSRRFELINRLLIKGKTIDMVDFAIEFYVSESSIRNDISYLNNILINCNEVRIAISRNQIYVDKKSESDLLRAIIYLNGIITSELSLDDKEKYIASIYDENIVNEVHQIVRGYIDALELNIAEHYIEHICNVLITLSSRVKGGHHVENNDNLLDYDRIKMMADALLSKQFLETISHRLNLNFELGDINFVSSYLRADRIQISNFDKIESKDLQVFRCILGRLEKIIGIRLDEEDELVKNLLIHMNAMVYRLRNDIIITNSLLENIKSEFGVLFNVLSVVFETENSSLDIKITDDEIGYLLIHIQNIIERQKKTKNILLVCPHGAVTSNLILSQIRELLPAYNFIETISIDRVDKVRLDSIDFVISTIDINGIDKPVIKISPIISKDDIRNIYNFYQNLIFSNHEYLHEYEHLARFVDKDLVFEMSDIAKEDLIKRVCIKLYDEGVVTRDYFDSLLRREMISSTDNIYGFALPHGDIKYVEKTKLCVVLLKKPLHWNKHQVSIVIFFNIHYDDLQSSKKILDDIYNLMHSERFKELMRQGIGKEEFLEFIKKDQND